MSAPLPRSEVVRNTGAVVRALAGHREIDVLVEAAGITASLKNGTIARVELDWRQVSVSEWRGAIDQLAFRLRFSDATLHEAATPRHPVARQLHDECEALRSAALGIRRYPGCRVNLCAVRPPRLTSKEARNYAPVAAIVNAFVIPLLAHRLGLDAADAPPPDPAFSATDVEDIASRVLALTRRVDDQAAFAACVRALTGALALPWEPLNTVARTGSEAEPFPRPTALDRHDSSAATSTTATVASTTGEVGDSTADASSAASIADIAGRTLRSVAPKSVISPYRAYCTEFDQVIPAGLLHERGELAALRLQLDTYAKSVAPALPRLANRLQRLLLAQRPSRWQFDVDDGLLDSGRLARVVVRPLTPLAFKAELSAPSLDTVVTLLIDNSGSMRGRPIANAAVCVEVLAAALERCGVRVEVLGFTTRSWNGGASRARWVGEGKPASPGRLGDLRHIVYKAADEPLRRARRNFGTMLDHDLLKENVDGEALLWAFHRLAGRMESRKVLIVISDGNPSEEATEAVNPPAYLDRHLESVVRGVERSGRVELLAIGIGYDVARHYRNALTIPDALALGESLATTLIALFERTRPSARGSGRSRSRLPHRRPDADPVPLAR